MATTFIVDDGERRQISYSANSWSSVPGNIQEYAGTRHSTVAGSSANPSLSFAFNGTKVAAYGTIPAGNTSMQIDCRIDDESIAVADIVTALNDQDLYHHLFCSGSPSSHGEHVFRLIVLDSSNSEHTLNFDYIIYEAWLGDSDGDQSQVNVKEVVMIDNSNTDQVFYSGSWESQHPSTAFNDTVHTSTVAGSTITLSFRGTVAAVYGTVGFSETNDTWTAKYQIDDLEPTGPLVSVVGTTAQNRILFYLTDLLPDVDHNLTVTYIGGPLPYTFDFFLYTSFPSSLIVTSSSPTLPPECSNSSAARGAPAPPHGEVTISIAGIAVMAVVNLLLTLLVLALFLRLRRRNQQQEQPKRDQSTITQYTVQESSLSPASLPPTDLTSRRTPHRGGKSSLQQIAPVQPSASSAMYEERTETEEHPPDYRERETITDAGGLF